MLLVPGNNPSVSGETAILDTLVAIGEERSYITLPFHLRMFLIGCLAEYIRDPDITHTVLALGFLQSSEKIGHAKLLLLKRTGDAALLLAGFYPERSRRLHVSSVYFHFMGQASYTSLSAHLQVGPEVERGRFFSEVASAFGDLANVLRATRSQAENEWTAFRRFRSQIG